MRKSLRSLFRGHAGLALAALALAALAGCYVTPARVEPSGEALDLCAERLHDLSGKLLMYRFAEGRLPQALADLGAGEPDAPACPASAKAYVYRRDGPAAPEGGGRMVIWDAAPSHNGGRWAVVLADPPGGAVTAKVVWLSEADFQKVMAKK